MTKTTWDTRRAPQVVFGYVGDLVRRALKC
jgi:hypothetical protein